MRVFSIDYANVTPFAASVPVADGLQSGTRRCESERELVPTVTAPAGSADASYPVSLWIHGGSCEFRRPSESWTGATVFAQASIVIASLGYRRSLEGFRCDSEAETYQVTDDLYLRLQWTRRNTPAFGGDVGDITIPGQSTGAALAFSLAADERTRGQIQHTVVMSSAFSLLSGSHLRRALAGIDVGRAPSTEVFSRADGCKVIRVQKLMSASSPSDPAIGPRFDSFALTLSTMVTTTSEEFFSEPSVMAMDELPMRERTTRRYAKGHRDHGEYPISAYTEYPMGNVIPDSAICSYAAKVAERSATAGLDVWAAQFEPEERLGYAPAGRISSTPYYIDIARFFGMKEPNHLFHQVTVGLIREGTSHMPRYNDDRKVTTFAGTSIQAVEGIAIDAWAAPRQLLGV